MIRRDLLRKVVVLGTATAACWLVQATAQTGPEHPAEKIRITECIVYPEAQPTQTTDCTGYVQSACKDMQVCEIKIGLALTGGRELGADARAWKKVRIRYRCGDVAKVNGPYVQSEHATVRLSCAGP